MQEEGSAEHTRMRAVRTKMTIPPVMDDIGVRIPGEVARESAMMSPAIPI